MAAAAVAAAAVVVAVAVAPSAAATAAGAAGAPLSHACSSSEGASLEAAALLELVARRSPLEMASQPRGALTGSTPHQRLETPPEASSFWPPPRFHCAEWRVWPVLPPPVVADSACSCNSSASSSGAAPPDRADEPKASVMGGGTLLAAPRGADAPGKV